MTRNFPEGWGYAFLVANSRLYEEERQDILAAAIGMFMQNGLKRNIKGEKFEGRITSDGKYGLIGTFGGQKFEANLETDRGKVYVSFLISEKVPYCMAVGEN